MRADRRATCTSQEPVSLSLVLYSSMILFLSTASDIFRFSIARTLGRTSFEVPYFPLLAGNTVNNARGRWAAEAGDGAADF